MMHKLLILLCFVAAPAVAAEPRFGTPEGCANALGDDRVAVITPSAFKYEAHEMACHLPPNAFSGERFTAYCKGEGMAWSSEMTIRMEGDAVIVNEDGAARTLARCDSRVPFPPL